MAKKLQLKKDDLKPYQSVLLLRVREKAKRPTPSELAEATRQLIRDEHVKQADVAVAEEGGLTVGYFTYEESVRAAWTSNAAIVDILQQLVVVCSKGDYFAVFASDNSVKELLRVAVKAQEQAPWKSLTFVESATLNAALLRSGPASTLWLSGIHRRVTSKVDNKVVTGLDLQYALDPLGDQTFFFTAARANARLGSTQAKVGVAPRKSAVWMGLSANWDGFCVAMRRLIDAIAACKNATQTPFPVLAEPIDGAKKGTLGDIYDAAIVPPEVMGNELSDEERQQAEKWSNAILEVRPGKAASHLDVALPGGHKVCTVDFTIELDGNGGTSLVLQSIAPEPDQEDDAKELERILRRRQGWIKLWFDSGVVFADRRLFRSRFRDLPFDSWEWADLSGYNADQEKPKNFDAKRIGPGKSLFCWVLNKWAPPKAKTPYSGGWLACNDGSMEIADFIHLDTAGSRPCLTLIHAKGAHSNSANRQVAVSPYEVVIGQAVKNIRHVDGELLAKQFDQAIDRRIKDAVWSDRTLCKRASMLTEIKTLKANFDCRVVVLQPHVQKTALDRARAGKGTAKELQALKQLDALLHSARASCVSAGAEFTVIGARA